MTDISTAAPIAIRRLKLPGMRFPRLRLGASLLAVAGLIGDAFKAAYVDPYSNRSGRPKIVAGEKLEGRDPSW